MNLATKVQQITLKSGWSNIIKKEFKNAGVQIGGGAMDSIDYELVCFVRRMANRCAEGNLKRLTPELMWCALGRNK